MNREIPNNIEAEKSVIGAMFLSKVALQKAIESLNNDSFFLDKHGKLFDCLKDLYNKGVAVDLTTVVDELKNKKILNRINIKIEKGEKIAIVGPSGSGKSTLLKLISSEIKPDEGKVKLNNKDISIALILLKTF